MHPHKATQDFSRWILIPGIFFLSLLGTIPLISYFSLQANFQIETYVYLGYFSAYLALFVAIFALRESVRFSIDEFFVWGCGFAVFASLVFLRSLVIDFSSAATFNSILLGRAASIDVMAMLLLALYVLLGASMPRQLKSFKSPVIAVSVGVLILLPLFLQKVDANIFLHQNAYSEFSKMTFALASAFMLISSCLIIRGRLIRHNASSVWLVYAFGFGSLAAVYPVFSQQFGDSFFYAGQFGLLLFVTILLAAFLAHKNRRLSVNQRLSDALRIGYHDLMLGKRAFHEIVENIAEGIVIIDSVNTIRFCNFRFAEMLGYPPSHVVGLHVSVFLTTDDYQKIAQNQIQTEKVQPYSLDLELRRKENETLPARLNITPIYDEKDRLAGTQLVASDLSERKRLEAHWNKLVDEKAERIELFRECVQHSQEGILITDPNGEIAYTNRSLEKMTGYDKAELIGKTTDILIYDEKSKLEHDKIWDSIKVGKAWRGEFHTRRRDASGFVGEIVVIPLKRDQGITGNCLWIEHDITRQKTLEKSLKNYAEELTQKTDELQSSKSYYGSLISAMSDILLVVDNAGQCTFVNDYGKKRLGCEAGDLTKTNLPIFFDDLKKLESDYGKAIQIEIKDFECQIKPREGEPILCSWYARPLFDRFNRRTGAMAVGRDITEYKKMQNELEDYAKNLEKSVEERTLELETKLTQLGKLLEIGEEIRLNGDVDVIINKICEAVQALGWRKVVISLRDYEKQVSQPVATAGLEPKQVEEVMSWRDIPFEHTDKYFKEHFRISHSYFIPHEEEFVSKETRYSVYSALNIESENEWHSLDALLVPIRTKDKVLGTISVDDPINKKRPGFDEIRDLEIFADKAAIAIENVRLFQVQKENEREAKFLADISRIFHASLNLTEVLEAVVEKGCTTIGEFCTLLLPDKGKELLMPEATFHSNPSIVDLFIKGTEEFPCHANEGIVGSVVSTGKASMFSRSKKDESNGFKTTIFHYLEEFEPISSLMVVPLKAPGKIIGAMAYVLFDTKRQYRKEELRLAQELASRAALAIENARLFQEAGQKAMELEKANRMKSEFLANVSHELRTPLNAIITLSDLLQRNLDQVKAEDQQKQLAIIHRSGRNLLNLINDILDLSKIESGKVEPIYSSVPLLAIVEETIEHIRPLCIKKGLTLEHEFEKNVPEEIYLDQDKLTKALTNILSNAVKFTRTGGVRLKMSMFNKKTLQIDVTDTGIGIPADRLDEIFNEFHQIDSTDSRSYGGTGLGLAITKRVLGIMGGDVSVKSQLGKGSTFSIRLPLKNKKEIRQIETKPAIPRILPAKKRSFPFEVEDDRERLNSGKSAILVVDDEIEARYITSRFLRENGYQLIFPRASEDVVELAKRYSPTAITLDIIMPHKSGWEILKALKDDEATQEIPVIMTSILHERDRALELGANDYLVKPFTAEAIISKLKNLENGAHRKYSRFEMPKLWNLRKMGRRNKAANTNSSPASASKQSRILLVDDDQDTRYAMRLILETAGYHVDFASEGREALKKADAVLPNLILMDIMMPGMDGYEATKALRANEKFRKVPIVAMTAKAMKGDREKTILAGCDDYIAKPFVTEDILELVRKWLSETNSN